MLHETLAQDHGIHCTPAEKTEKCTYQEAMNSDFHSGRIRLLGDSELASEMSALEWDLSLDSREALARRGKLRESPNQSNDLCDAFLYVWRRSIHRWETERHVAKAIGSDSWWEEWDRREADRYSQRRSMDPDDDTSGVMTIDNLPVGWN
jgi:hypothetical protein